MKTDSSLIKKIFFPYFMLVTRLLTSFTLSEIAMPVLAKVSSILKKKVTLFCGLSWQKWSILLWKRLFLFLFWKAVLITLQRDHSIFFFGKLSKNVHNVKHCWIVSLLTKGREKRVNRHSKNPIFRNSYYIFYVIFLLGLLAGNTTLVNPSILPYIHTCILSSVHFIVVSYITFILQQIILFPWPFCEFRIQHNTVTYRFHKHKNNSMKALWPTWPIPCQLNVS